MLSLSSALRCQSAKARGVVFSSLCVCMCVCARVCGGGGGGGAAQVQHTAPNSPTPVTPQCLCVCVCVCVCVCLLLHRCNVVCSLTMKFTTMHAQISSTNTSNVITTRRHTCMLTQTHTHTHTHTDAESHGELTQMSLLGHGSS